MGDIIAIEVWIWVGFLRCLIVGFHTEPGKHHWWSNLPLQKFHAKFRFAAQSIAHEVSFSCVALLHSVIELQSFLHGHSTTKHDARPSFRWILLKEQLTWSIKILRERSLTLNDKYCSQIITQLSFVWIPFPLSIPLTFTYFHVGIFKSHSYNLYSVWPRLDWFRRTLCNSYNHTIVYYSLKRYSLNYNFNLYILMRVTILNPAVW